MWTDAKKVSVHMVHFSMRALIGRLEVYHQMRAFCCH